MTTVGVPDEQIDLLVAQGKYQLAASRLSEICRAQPRNVGKREQLAEVLTLAGKPKRAFRVLEELVNDYARVGLFATAIAMLKKMQRIEPGRRDLDFKLAVLVAKHETAGGEGAKADPQARPRGRAVGPAIRSKATPGTSDQQEILRNTVLERDALRRADRTPDVQSLEGSALFEGLTAEQLEALIGGLQLTSVQPGEIVVAEGEPGESLFLIASGSVRVYVRDRTGRQRQIRIMRQGDFFGEISLLKGTPRTATITAATKCELLELDRPVVTAIARKHPPVWDVVEELCTRRAGSAEELGARGGA